MLDSPQSATGKRWEQGDDTTKQCARSVFELVYEITACESCCMGFLNDRITLYRQESVEPWALHTFNRHQGNCTKISRKEQCLIHRRWCGEFSLRIDIPNITSRPVAKSGETIQVGHIKANTIPLTEWKTDIEGHWLTQALVIVKSDFNTADQSVLSE